MVCRRGAQWGLPRILTSWADSPAGRERIFFCCPAARLWALIPKPGSLRRQKARPRLPWRLLPPPATPFRPTPPTKAMLTRRFCPCLPMEPWAMQGADFISAPAGSIPSPGRYSAMLGGAHLQGARGLLRDYPNNRLIRHIMDNCVARYDCPAARKFALGRYEAPLPSSRSCNASCIGCISAQEKIRPFSPRRSAALPLPPAPKNWPRSCACTLGVKPARPSIPLGRVARATRS